KQTEMVMPYAGTLSSMIFWINSAGTGNLVLNVRKNEANCSITKTVTTDFQGFSGDVVHTCTAAAGDTGNWQAVCTGTCAGLFGIAMALKATSGGCDPTVPSNCKPLLGATINFTATAGTTNYSTPYGKNISTTEANQRFPLPRGGTLENCAAYVATAGSGGNTTTLTAMKNGSPGNCTVVINSGVSGVVNGTGTDTFAARDQVDMRIASVGGTGPVMASWSSDLH